jgi:hypothetical protein
VGAACSASWAEGSGPDFRTRENSNEFRYHLARTVSFYRSGNHCDILLKALNNIDENRYNLAAKIDILFYRALCNQSLGNYTTAREQYWAVSMLLSDPDSPLAREVQSRLKEVQEHERSAVRRIKLEYYRLNVDPARLAEVTLPALLIISTIAFLGFLFLWKREWLHGHIDYSLSFLEKPVFKRGPESRKTDGGDGFRKNGTEPVIVEPADLISEEEMIALDGRVSIADVMHYKTAGETSEVGPHARLIVEGHKMIRDLNRLPPYTLVLLQKMPYIGKLPPFWQDTFFGFGLVGAWTGFSYLIDYGIFSLEKPDLVVRFLIATVFIAALAGIRIMSLRTVDALDELVTLVEKNETLSEIRRLVTSLFRSPGQAFIALILFTIFFYSSVIEKGRYSINIPFVFLLCILFSPLIWFLIQGVFLTSRLSRLEDLETNPLSPMKTLGLQKWISVIGSYALVGSIVLTTAGSLPLFRAFITGGQYTVWQSIWLLLFLPIIVLAWIYPYAKLKVMVRKIKRRRMHLLKTIISRTFNDWVQIEKCMKEICGSVDKDMPDRESIIKALDERFELYNKIRPEFEQMKGYHTIFNEIDKSPESFFDLRAALELAQVMGIPTLFAALSYLARQVPF